MLHFGARARVVCVVAGASTLAACASIFGIDTPDVDLGLDGGGTDDGSTDGTVVGEGATDDGGADAHDGSVPPDAALDSAPDVLLDSAPETISMDVQVPDAAVCGLVPDPTQGVFVATNGVDSASCGSSTAPCLTIQNGINRAVTIGQKSYVYVAAGAYAEALTLSAGLTVWGGWNIVTVDGGDAWSGACSPTNPVGIVTIQPTTSNITVTASTPGASVGLKTLTILSKPQANVASGESLYGIFTSGTTNLVLDDVDITMGAGGDGATGYTADGGAPGNPSCLPGTGAPGSPAGADGGGADAGALSTSGYVPTSGSIGGNGVAGANGVSPEAGTCAQCVTCTAGTAGLGCTQGLPMPSCGGTGMSGCGGGGGGGGGGGSGGGSSFALYAWGANVTVAGGTLAAGNGGAGGEGGNGGPGGQGSLGASGQNQTPCDIECNGGLSCGTPTVDAGMGSAGTKGGNGSHGGAGGSGAGGWSCAVVLAAGATLNYSAMLNHGNYGSSPGGSIGVAGQVCQ